jgi:predicted PurR-regulated permease PerM
MQALSLSWSSIWRIVAVGLMTALALYSWEIILGLFLAIVISAGLDFIIDWLERRGLPRTLSVVLIFIGGGLLALLIAYTVIPLLIDSLVTVVSAFDKELATTWLVPLQSSASASLIFSRFSRKFLSGGTEQLQTAAATFEPLAILATILVSAFYLSLSRDGIEQFLRNMLPRTYEEGVLRIYKRARKKIGSWFRAQVLLGLLVGSLTWGTLWLIGIKQAALFGLFAGAFELVPLLGPIVAGVIAVGVTLVTDPLSAIWVFLVFFAIHQIEGNVLIPLLTKQTVGLHPVVVIAVLLIGYQLAGIMGTLAAVPAAVVLQEILEEVTRMRRRQTIDESIPMPRA